MWKIMTCWEVTAFYTEEIADELGYDSETELYTNETTAQTAAEDFRKEDKFSDVIVSDPIKREVLLNTKRKHNR